MASTALDFERRVSASPGQVRATLTRALEHIGFKVTASGLTVLEAKRGSALAGGFSKAKTPIGAEVGVDLEPDAGPDGPCVVRVRLIDRLGGLGGGSTMMPVDSPLEEVRCSLDAALGALDPDGARWFGPARFSSVADGGGRRSGEAPMAWGEHDAVAMRCGDQLAWLSMAETQAHLAIAGLVAGEQGALPPNLTAELERFAMRLEHILETTADPVVVIAVAPDERPVLEFMHLQVRIRSSLPVRTLHKCRDCRTEKITNPDFERLVQRNQRIRSVAGGLGASFTRGGVAPFVLVGTLFHLKRLDPDYVCPRCQGLEADETLATFCPACGDLRKDAVLRVCPKCQHDFRSALGPEEFWRTIPSLTDLPVGSPPIGPGGGKACSGCSREFAALWRVVIDVWGWPQERFVCGTGPGCMPPSLVAPVQV
jgi:hypothetical protein